jgi:hypothetical protein
MRKPTKAEFAEVLNDYIVGGLEDMADVWAQVDDWTDYYRSKFIQAISDWRASA